MELSEIPELPGWVALTDAAKELGVTRQAAHKMIKTGVISTAHKIGPVPVYVMERTELDRLIARRTPPQEVAAVS